MVTDHAALRHSVRLRLHNPPEVSVLRKDFFFAYYLSVYLWGSLWDTLWEKSHKQNLQRNKYFDKGDTVFLLNISQSTSKLAGF